MAAQASSPMETLTLLAVAVAGTAGATAAALATKAKPFIAHDSGASPATIKTTIDRLVAEGDLDIKPGKSPRYTLTLGGKRRLEALVGPLPAKGSWAGFRDTLLLPTIVGSSKRAKPTFGLIRGSIIAHALAGDDSILQVKTESDLLNRLAAVLVHAARPDPTLIKNAIIRRWLSSPAVSDMVTSEEPTTDGFDYSGFAQRVLEAAKTSIGVGLGDKAFISRVWLRMQADGTTFDLDRNRFNAALLEANRRRMLSLSRADLSLSLDRNDVQESEVDWHGDTFHFVETMR